MRPFSGTYRCVSSNNKITSLSSFSLFSTVFKKNNQPTQLTYKDKKNLNINGVSMDLTLLGLFSFCMDNIAADPLTKDSIRFDIAFTWQ